MKDFDKLIERLYHGSDGADEQTIDSLLDDAADAISFLRSAEQAAFAKQKLLRLAEITAEANEIYDYLKKDWFEDMWGFGASKIYRGCTIDDEGLKDSNGDLLSGDGRCMDEPLGYFVNQWTGYCEDDYHGTMYVSVDDEGTFVAVDYDC